MEPITFRCSACEQLLRVAAEKAGRKAKCTRCGKVVTIPAAAEPEEEEFEVVEDEPRAAPAKASPKPARPADDEPEEDEPAATRVPVRESPLEDDDEDKNEDAAPQARRRSLRDRDELDEDNDEAPREPRGASDASRWQVVRLGLLLVAIAACILGGAAVLDLFAGFLAMLVVMGSMSGAGDTVPNIARIAEVFKLASGAVAVVGLGVCTVVPDKHGARILAGAALALAVVGTLLGFSFRTLPLFGSWPPVLLHGFKPWDRFGVLLRQLGIVLPTAAALVVFSLYLRAVGRSLRDDDRAQTGLHLAFLAGGYAFLQAVVVGLGYYFVHSDPTSLSSMKTMIWVWSIFNWIGLFVLGGFLFWLVSTLLRLRPVLGAGAVARARRHPSRGPRQQEEVEEEEEEEEPDRAAPRRKRSREEEPEDAAPRRKRRRPARQFEDSPGFPLSRNRIMGIVGIVLGLGGLTASLGRDTGGGAYGAGSMAGLVLCGLLFVVGLFYAIRG